MTFLLYANLGWGAIDGEGIGVLHILPRKLFKLMMDILYAL